MGIGIGIGMGMGIALASLVQNGLPGSLGRISEAVNEAGENGPQPAGLLEESLCLEGINEFEDEQQLTGGCTLSTLAAGF
jgi:hypothetical protein